MKSYFKSNSWLLLVAASVGYTWEGSIAEQIRQQDKDILFLDVPLKALEKA